MQTTSESLALRMVRQREMKAREEATEVTREAYEVLSTYQLTKKSSFEEAT